MAIVRAAHHSRFTVLADSIMKDPRLSLREIGLLAVMLRLPDDWKFSIAGLASICKDGKDAIRQSVKTLEACGYVRREILKDKQSNLSRYAYTVFEEPQFPPSENPPSEIPPSENPTRYNTQQPNTEKQNTQQPNTEPSDAVPGANTVKQKQGAKGTGEEGTVSGSSLPADRSDAKTNPGSAARPGGKAKGSDAGERGGANRNSAAARQTAAPRSNTAARQTTAPRQNTSTFAGNRASPHPNAPPSKPRKTSAFARAEEVKWRALLESYAPPEGF
ncbi:MAG: hypothetical protein IKI59_01985 [Clostridia bacterium]|nr:hypothetical protein [Clostridia bacterium]